MRDPKIDIANWMENNWLRDMEEDRKSKRFAFMVAFFSFAACGALIALCLLFGG